MDKYALYELCVTDGPRLARFIAAVHGQSPRILREDFSGSAALAKAWAASIPGASAIAVDSDPAPLKRARAPKVRAVTADVMDCALKADAIAATNFPLGYFHDRASLVAYLASARRNLRPRGVFLADLYGGRDAFTPMTIKRALRGPRGERIRYTWAQRDADPATGLVVDTLSFTVTPTKLSSKSRACTLTDAFVYHWRLWSIPELQDALADAGFRTVELYSRMGDALDTDGNLYVRPHDEHDTLDDNWVVYLVGRK